MEFICNDLKFKNKQIETQYVLLNSRIKTQKKENKAIKKLENKVKAKMPKILKSSGKRARKTSKFQNKYKDRIDSIKTTDDSIQENRKLYHDDINFQNFGGTNEKRIRGANK